MSAYKPLLARHANALLSGLHPLDHNNTRRNRVSIRTRDLIIPDCRNHWQSLFTPNFVAENIVFVEKKNLSRKISTTIALFCRGRYQPHPQEIQHSDTHPHWFILQLTHPRTNRYPPAIPGAPTNALPRSPHLLSRGPRIRILARRIRTRWYRSL